MLKRNKNMILAAVVLPFILGASSTFAKGGDGLDGPNTMSHKYPPMKMCRFAGAPTMMAPMNRHMIGALHLTDEQKATIKSIRIADKKKMKTEKEVQAKRINRLLLADKFDKAAADNLAIEIENNRVAHRVVMLESQFKILHILTPTQKGKLIDLQKERNQQCAKWMASHKDKRH